MKPKLIFVEGLPNSGKTTLLDLIYEFLISNHVKARALYEDKGDNPIEYYCNDEIIRRFLSLVENDDITYIVECAMLQNPLRLFLLKNNTSVDELEKRVQKICRLFSRYEIVIFMNYHNEPADIFENNARRGSGWTGACIDEFTSNEFGRQRNYKGIEGTLLAYQELSGIQLSIFRKLRCRQYLVNNSGYESGNRDQQVIEILSGLYSI
jgi:hypothetical protein